VNPLAFGAIFGISLFGGISIERFEKALAKDLGHTLVGEHKSIVVRAKVSLATLDGVLPRVTVVAKDFTCDTLPFRVEPWRSHYGHIRHLQVEMSHFVLKGLPVENLQTNLPDVRFDFAYALSRHHFRVVRSGSGPMTVTLRLSDLQDFVAKKYAEFSGFTIRSDGKRIVASGKVAFAGFKVPFEVSGVPTVQAESKLLLAEPNVLVNGKPVDPVQAFSLFKGFSSLLDLNHDLGANGAIHLKSFEVSDELLIGRGTAQIQENQGAVQKGELPKSGNESPPNIVSKS
jgi:hypothetical protein